MEIFECSFLCWKGTHLFSNFQCKQNFQDPTAVFTGLKIKAGSKIVFAWLIRNGLGEQRDHNLILFFTRQWNTQHLCFPNVPRERVHLEPFPQKTINFDIPRKINMSNFPNDYCVGVSKAAWWPYKHNKYMRYTSERRTVRCDGRHSRKLDNLRLISGTHRKLCLYHKVKIVIF